MLTARGMSLDGLALEAAVFEKEWETYQARKSELLAREGEYVVIRGDEILGVFPTLPEAYDEGIRAYRSARFFLHRIAAVEPTAIASPFLATAVKDSPIQYPPL